MDRPIHQASVVQNLDSAIQWIKLYPVDNAIGFPNTYPLDSYLSSGKRYPMFEQLGPGLKFTITFQSLRISTHQQSSAPEVCGMFVT